MGPVSRAWRLLATEGIAAVVGRAWRRLAEGPRRGPLSDRQYARWLAERRRTAPSLEALREAARSQPYRPLISVVMPIHAIAEVWLRRALDSVRAQVYADWELCAVNDAAPGPVVRRLLAEYAAGDGRVRMTHLSSNQGIAGASNVGLRMATGEFVGFLDHDDELYPDALLEVVRFLNARPETDLVYSDEDKIEPSGRRVQPFFKPDWSPDLLLSMNYIGHFVACRRSLLEAVGGFREGLDGSQDHDLLLRVTERTPRIGHVPRVLYGWRQVAGSAARDPSAKPAATAAGERAVAEALARRGVDASVEVAAPGRYAVRYAFRGEPRVSIIVPMRDRAALTRQCIASLEARTRYRNWELIVIDNGSRLEASRRFLAAVAARHRVLASPGPFNYSALNNLGAAQATGAHLLFLNNDTEAVGEGWLEALLAHSERAEIGAVGARLLFPDGRIQHAGVFLMGGQPHVAGHAFKHLRADTLAWRGLAQVPRNVIAVTGAGLMVRRAVFEEVGGFDERIAVILGDVDLCLRIGERGYRIVYTPEATLIHHESATRGRRPMPGDVGLMVARWHAKLERGDPYYNPNLSRFHEDLRLGFDR
jgi:GT2 family glycosyltransferase